MLLQDGNEMGSEGCCLGEYARIEYNVVKNLQIHIINYMNFCRNM